MQNSHLQLSGVYGAWVMRVTERLWATGAVSRWAPPFLVCIQHVQCDPLRSTSCISVFEFCNCHPWHNNGESYLKKKKKTTSYCEHVGKLLLQNANRWMILCFQIETTDADTQYFWADHSVVTLQLQNTFWMIRISGLESCSHGWVMLRIWALWQNNNANLGQNRNRHNKILQNVWIVNVTLFVTIRSRGFLCFQHTSSTPPISMNIF